MTVLPLRRVFTIVNGGTPTSDAENWDGDIAWATPIDIGRGNGTYIHSTQRTLTVQGLTTGSSLVPAGSLILSTRAPIGYVAETTVPMAFNQGCRGLVPRTALDVRFFRYQLQVSADRLQSLGQGSTFLELTTDSLASSPLMVPPLATQRAVADYLDAEADRIDALVQLSRQQQQLNAERVRTRIITAMDRLAGVWGTIPLRRLVTCLDGRRIPLNAEERATRQGDYPYYGASGIVDHIDDFLFDETLVLLGEDGAQLGDPTYQIAQVVVGKVWVNNHAHVLRPHADPDFLAFRLNTFDRMMVMSGSTREKITQEDMGRIPVPNLPLAVQEQVSSELRYEAEQTARLNDGLQQRVALLLERRQALITAAITGELAIPGVAA